MFVFIGSIDPHHVKKSFIVWRWCWDGWDVHQGFLQVVRTLGAAPTIGRGLIAGAWVNTWGEHEREGGFQEIGKYLSNLYCNLLSEIFLLN